MPFRDAGPWHEAPVCSQMPMVTRLAPTATPEPLLEPRGTRSVSYGLHGLARPRADALGRRPPCSYGSATLRLDRPGRALNSCAFDFA